MNTYEMSLKHKPLTNYIPLISEDKRKAQKQVIIDMLRVGPCHCGQFIGVGIAQYNARIKELRQEGHNIIYLTKQRRFVLQMKEGEKYLVLQIGDMKIPFFPNESKDGKKFYATSAKIWVNEKQKQKDEV